MPLYVTKKLPKVGTNVLPFEQENVRYIRDYSEVKNNVGPATNFVRSVFSSAGLCESGVFT